MLATALCLVALAGPGSCSNPLVLSAPVRAPSGVSNYIDNGFVSFSIAAHFFPEYAGNLTSPNLFTRTLLRVLARSTGKAPYIRVGGTSSQKLALNITQEGQDGVPKTETIGPTYFEGFYNFPGSRFHFDLANADLGPNRVPNAVAEAKIALSYIKGNLESFEIGNEPNVYNFQGYRPANYSQDDYVGEWSQIATAVSENVLTGNQYGINPRTSFQALTYFLGPFGSSSFDVTSAFNTSHVDQDGFVKSASLHIYPAGANPSRQHLFMNHTNTASTLDVLIPAIKYLATSYPNIPLVLGETNSDYINIGNQADVSAFGNSLWVCDYMLYAMSINVKRVYMHQGTTFGYSDFTPTEVRPPFYGQLLVAAAIGTSPRMQIKPVNLGLWNLSIYAMYTESILSKYVVINLEEWNETTPYDRPFRSFNLEVPSDVHVTSKDKSKYDIRLLKFFGVL
ncbi:hypothetical protein G7Y89_g11308 [Cudoniella acicularis]|uniref:Beta-glucuronidase C-terminal domain-containing protein n=1 Tax=Cudoniella acicularis TaxID=354080 RepID=A0A8H4RDG3_9HELO|nr:hypothetical protein G7Y89_g11308 [Cudoniella acicularis]